MAQCPATLTVTALMSPINRAKLRFLCMRRCTFYRLLDSLSMTQTAILAQLRPEITAALVTMFWNDACDTRAHSNRPNQRCRAGYQRSRDRKSLSRPEVTRHKRAAVLSLQHWPGYHSQMFPLRTLFSCGMLLLLFSRHSRKYILQHSRGQNAPGNKSRESDERTHLATPEIEMGVRGQ